MSYSTLHEMERGKRSAFADAKLDAVADALKLPRADVRAAAGRPQRAGQPFALPDRARYLSAKERRAVLAVVDALLEAKGVR